MGGTATVALAELLEAVDIEPRYAPGQLQLGVALLASDRPHAALPHLERARALGLERAESMGALGMARARMGRDPEAIEPLEEARAENPDLYGPTLELAWLRLRSDHPGVRDPAEAQRLARSLVARGGVPRVRGLELLAAARAEQGAFGDAQRLVERAQSLAKLLGNERLAHSLSHSRQAYAGGETVSSPVRVSTANTSATTANSPEP